MPNREDIYPHGDHHVLESINTNIYGLDPCPFEEIEYSHPKI